MSNESPMMTILVNPRGGTAHRPDALPKLRTLLAERLPSANVQFLGPHDHVTECAHAAIVAGATTVVAVGGDGTINGVAQAVIGSSAKLGVIPFGTLNHFARAVDIPVDVELAVQLLQTPAERCIDVGSVNNHYFLNNASLGLYPELVELRERQTHVASKPLRWVRALWEVIHTGKPISLKVQATDVQWSARAWLLFVGNNQYSLGLLNAGQRRHLDQHILDVLMVRAQRRWRVAFLALRAGRGVIHPRLVRRIATPELTVDVLSKGPCVIAFDGEAKPMKPPFVFRSLSQSLRVVAPPNGTVPH